MGFPPVRTRSFEDRVTRIVESQEQVATTKITANLEEQDLLESMLEASKPGQLRASLHYLLSTPFRYPPLRYGSRFGSRTEPALFYASLDLATCLQECAYYRFIFWYDMERPPPKAVSTQHTVFRVDVKSESSVDLRGSEYDGLRDDLNSAVSYTQTQKLGSHLRSSGVELLIYTCARGPGDNVAIFEPSVFTGSPVEPELWNSELSRDRVLLRGPKGLFRFPLSQFAEQGNLLRV